jgi:molybdopterin-guanine dinucleotide biosynthesis protein A
VFGMIVDSLILAGGRSSRLGHSDKRNLLLDGETLLQRSVDAVRQAGARRVVVVGDEGVDDVVAVREDPAFAGPVAAIAAGLRALPGDADAVVVIACDMPRVGGALPILLDAFSGEGVIAVDRGRRQQLAIVVLTTALAAAIDQLPTVVDASMRALLGTLDLVDVVVPEGSTDDIDTWDDAARFGITRTIDRSPPMTESDPPPADDADGILADWSNEVRAALGIEADVDIRSVLGLAGVVAHSVVRPAAPLTTYLVGFAAGRAAALGEDPATAAADATRTAKDLAARRS